jgi:hypothetical protein
MKRPAIGLLVLAILPGAAYCADLREIRVDYDGEVYTVDSAVWFAASQQAVFEVFSDWDLSEQFSSAIVESRNLGPDANGRYGYYVRNRGCILFFCRSVERTGTVERQPLTRLRAVADPDKSDFALSDERWTFEAEGGGTLVHYRLRLKPDFWVPPVIGPWAIKHKLRDDGGEALDRIEAIARARAAANG